MKILFLITALFLFAVYYAANQFDKIGSFSSLVFVCSSQSFSLLSRNGFKKTQNERQFLHFLSLAADLFTFLI
jgi:hypothetical protein